MNKSKIFAKVAEIAKERDKKVDLSKGQIELGAVQDLQKSGKSLRSNVEKADKAWRKYQDYLTGADKPFSAMLDAYDKLTKDWADVNTALNKVEKSAKELGVSTKDIEGYNAAFENLKTAKRIIEVINSFDDPSKFQ